MDRAAAERRSFGFRLFASGKDEGLLMRPETGTFCIGDTEAAFSVANLRKGRISSCASSSTAVRRR